MTPRECLEHSGIIVEVSSAERAKRKKEIDFFPIKRDRVE